MSKKRPLIGLPGRRIQASLLGYPPIFGFMDADVYFVDYARGIIEAGGFPIHLPLDAPASELAERLDGVLLCGGADIDPAQYDAEPHPSVKDLEPERDVFEFELLKASLEQEVPVLGVCRGLQILNIHQGGTLHQHVESHSRYDLAASGEAHDVHFEDGSALATIYGPTRRVNSLHHQIVDELGADLSITGRSPEGTVEGLEYEDLVVAVQWHPEMMETRSTDPIFGWLVDRASRD